MIQLIGVKSKNMLTCPVGSTFLTGVLTTPLPSAAGFCPTRHDAERSAASKPLSAQGVHFLHPLSNSALLSNSHITMAEACYHVVPARLQQGYSMQEEPLSTHSVFQVAEALEPEKATAEHLM